MEKRYLGRVAKWLFIRFGTDKLDSLGFSNDLSETGLFIKTNLVLQKGTVLNIQVTLPDDNKIDLTGKVAWIKKDPSEVNENSKKIGLGIRLLKIPKSYTQFIEKIR